MNLKEIKKLSKRWKIKVVTCSNLFASCNDSIYFIIKKKGKKIKECYFSDEEACMITSSAASILSFYILEMDKEEMESLISNSFSMLKGKEYSLIKYPNLMIFKDFFFLFPKRVNCVSLVVECLNKLSNLL